MFKSWKISKPKVLAIAAIFSVLQVLSINQSAHAAAKYPSRIISLSPSATEDLFAIGAGKQVLAVDSLSNYPKNAPISKLDAFTPNVEAIAAKKPDLVILQSSATKATSVKAALEKLKIKVFFEETPSAIDGVYAELKSLGAVTGHTSQATALIAQMKVKIQSAIASVKNSSAISVFHEVDSTLYSAASSTFIGGVYKSFGLINVADAAATADSYGYPQLTSEYLIQVNPSVVFLADGQSSYDVAARPGWNGITAVQKNQIVSLPEDIASRWGVRLVNLYQLIADALKKVK